MKVIAKIRRELILHEDKILTRDEWPIGLVKWRERSVDGVLDVTVNHHIAILEKEYEDMGNESNQNS